MKSTPVHPFLPPHTSSDLDSGYKSSDKMISSDKKKKKEKKHETSDPN